MLLIVISYASAAAVILKHARKNDKEDKTETKRKSKNQKQEANLQKRIHRTVNIIALCVTSYLFCWIPNQVSHIYGFYHNGNNISIHKMTICLLSFNAIANPFIYVLTSKKWKSVIVECWPWLDKIWSKTNKTLGVKVNSKSDCTGNGSKSERNKNSSLEKKSKKN